MTMIVDTIISDHLVLLRRATEFCLRLGCDMLDKVILKLVNASPGSVVIAKEPASLSTDGTLLIYTPGQVTSISPVVLRQPEAVAWLDRRAMEPSLVLSCGLSSHRRLRKGLTNG